MKRIQRKRAKGWRMPENAVYVGRPSRWGNPVKPKTVFYSTWYVEPEELKRNLDAYENWLRQKLSENPQFLDPLKGKDLACWCPLDKPCHADVLLKFLREANPTPCIEKP